MRKYFLSLLRAFPSREVKFLAYTTSKPKILAFNISLYNTSYIKNSNKYYFMRNGTHMASIFIRKGKVKREEKKHYVQKNKEGMS